MKNGISAPRKGKAPVNGHPVPVVIPKEEIIDYLLDVFKNSHNEQNKVLAGTGLLISLK